MLHNMAPLRDSTLKTVVQLFSANGAAYQRLLHYRSQLHEGTTGIRRKAQGEHVDQSVNQIGREGLHITSREEYDDIRGNDHLRLQLLQRIQIRVAEVNRGDGGRTNAQVLKDGGIYASRCGSNITFLNVAQNVLRHLVTVVAHRHSRVPYDALEHLTTQATASTKLENPLSHEFLLVVQNPLHKRKARLPRLERSAVGRTLQLHLQHLLAVRNGVVAVVVLSLFGSTVQPRWNAYAWL